MARVIADCRQFPSESGCGLTISGEPDEVMRAATEHAVSVHGEKDSPKLRKDIKKILKPERGAGAVEIEEPVQKSLNSPDERRPFERGHVDVVNMETVIIGKGTFEPGWRWSNDVKPIAGTETCEQAHTGVVLKGHMNIKMNDGTELHLGPGDAFEIPPGHEAWIVGDETCEALDFTGYDIYAKPKEQEKVQERRPEPEERPPIP